MDDRHIKRLGLALLSGDFVLVVIHLTQISTGEIHWLVRTWFDLNAEGTIPAWYTSAQLLLAGVLFLYAAGSRRADEGVRSWFLAALGAGFCFLSADETVRVHENITVVLRDFESLPRFSGDHGMWIPLYVSVGVGFVVATGGHWRRLLTATRTRLGTIWLIAGALVFVAGAVGIEILSYGELREIQNRRLYSVAIAAEEGLEMCGATAMLVGAAILSFALVSRANGPVPVPRGTDSPE